MWNLWLDRSKRSADTAIAGRCRRLPSGSAVRRFLLVQGKHAGLYAAAVQQIQAWVASGQLSLPPVSKKFDLDNIHEVLCFARFLPRADAQLSMELTGVCCTLQRCCTLHVRCKLCVEEAKRWPQPYCTAKGSSSGREGTVCA